MIQRPSRFSPIRPNAWPFRSATFREEIVERCVYPLINEGIRILEEGVAARAGDVDVVWCAGYGFPRYRGGPLFYADAIGLKTVYKRNSQSIATNSAPCTGTGAFAHPSGDRGPYSERLG